MESWEVTAESAGARVDSYLAEAMAVSRGEAQRLLESGFAQVTGSSAKTNYRLKAGDNVTSERPAAIPTQVEAEAIPLSVVFEDKDLLVVDKPRGMVVHPAPGSSSGTLVNAVLAHAGDLS